VIFKEKGIDLCKKRGKAPKKRGGRGGYVKKRKKKGKGSEKTRYFILNLIYL